jgi:hypothetical protein
MVPPDQTDIEVPYVLPNGRVVEKYIGPDECPPRLFLFTHSWSAAGEYPSDEMIREERRALRRYLQRRAEVDRERARAAIGREAAAATEAAA